MDIPSIVSLDVFDWLKEGLANSLGSTTDVAGYVIGFILFIVITIALALFIGKEHPTLVIIGAGGSAAFCALVGFWPWWVMIIVGLLVALLLIRPFASGTGV